MKYMLDTNICIYLIRSRSQSVIEEFRKHKPEDVCISSITHAELEYGVQKSMAKDKNRIALELFLSGISILPYDTKAAMEYGHVRGELEEKGLPIGALDTLIAAHARSCSLILVTNNTREFERVAGLDIEDWVSRES